MSRLRDIKHENHDMALVFGNEMTDAVAKQAASAAAPRGAAAEQVAWVDAVAWQVQRRIVEANMQASKATPTGLASCERGLRRAQYKTVLQSLFEKTTHQVAFRRSRHRWDCHVCRQGMGETSLVRWLRAGPCVGGIQTYAEFWKLHLVGSETGSCESIYSHWLEDCTHLAFSGPISRNYVVLELCGMGFSITVQIEHAMFGCDQDVGTGRFEQNQVGVPAAWWEKVIGPIIRGIILNINLMQYSENSVTANAVYCHQRWV